MTDLPQNPAIEPVWRDRPAGRLAVEVPEIDAVLAQLPGEIGGPAVDHGREADAPLRTADQHRAQRIKLATALVEPRLQTGDLSLHRVAALALRPTQVDLVSVEPFLLKRIPIQFYSIVNDVGDDSLNERQHPACGGQIHGVLLPAGLLSGPRLIRHATHISPPGQVGRPLRGLPNSIIDCQSRLCAAPWRRTRNSGRFTRRLEAVGETFRPRFSPSVSRHTRPGVDFPAESSRRLPSFPSGKDEQLSIPPHKCLKGV